MNKEIFPSFHKKRPNATKTIENEGLWDRVCVREKGKKGREKRTRLRSVRCGDGDRRGSVIEDAETSRDDLVFEIRSRGNVDVFVVVGNDDHGSLFVMAFSSAIRKEKREGEGKGRGKQTARVTLEPKQTSPETVRW